MEINDRYIVQTNSGVNKMEVIAVTSDKKAMKVKWGHGECEWLYLADFKSVNDFARPQKTVLGMY